MRPLVFASVLVVAGCVHGCTPHTPQVKEEPKPTEAATNPAFPTGYQQWARLNEEPIVREEEGEMRFLFANETAAGTMGSTFATGSILVKAQHRLGLDESGTPRQGDLYKISMMHKEGTGPNGGWVFRAFDAETKEELGGEAEACVICHSQRAAADYTFRALEAIAP